jgi:TPR repeat protein
LRNGCELSLTKSQTYGAVAAEQNDAEAQYLLGMLLLQSDGGDRVDAGREWLDRSAVGGYPLARAALLTLPLGKARRRLSEYQLATMSLFFVSSALSDSVWYQIMPVPNAPECKVLANLSGTPI